jgi:hypothetical protein
VTAQQLAIFADPTARRTDPLTSVEAAASVPTGALEALILLKFTDHGPMTDDELCELLPEVFAPTAKTCRSRLVRRGLLVPTAERRPSSRNRDQVVWSLPCR